MIDCKELLIIWIALLLHISLFFWSLFSPLLADVVQGPALCLEAWAHVCQTIFNPYSPNLSQNSN